MKKSNNTLKTAIFLYIILTMAILFVSSMNFNSKYDYNSFSNESDRLNIIRSSNSTYFNQSGITVLLEGEHEVVYNTSTNSSNVDIYFFNITFEILAGPGVDIFIFNESEYLIWNNTPSEFGAIVSNSSQNGTVFLGSYPGQVNTSILVVLANLNATRDLTVNYTIYCEHYTMETITITNPTDSTSIQAGSTREITWISRGDISNVNILLYYMGSYQSTIVSNTPNDGSYSWTLEDNYANYGDFYQIRIEDYSNGSTYDMSDAYFEITPLPDSLILINPSSTTSWEAGSSHMITWEYTGLVSVVTISLYYMGSYQSTIVSNTPNDGTYSWTLEDTYADYGDFYQIRIEDSTNSATYDMSDYFEIKKISPTITVTSPNGWSSWEAGSTQEITWTSTGDITHVNIYLMYSWFGVLDTIAVNTPNDGSFFWTLDSEYDDYGDHYDIRIEDSNDPSIYDENEMDFEIREADSDPSNDTSNNFPIPGFDPLTFLAIFGLLGMVIIMGYYRKFKNHA
ncbi:MAG: Ser-Thr-rich GPI-anchored membrane family protein [Promethearchaeota archaeon]